MIGHTFHLLQSLEIARLHVPPIVASNCKWISWEATPIGRATSRNNLRLVELLIVRLLDTQSRTTGGATTHKWWCDHTRLVVRPCKTCLRLVISKRSQTVLNMTVDLVATDFACTITHDHYDQWHVILHFSIVTWL